MINLDQLTGLLQLAVLFKLFVLVLALFYFVFAIVIYRQITLMTQILDSKVSPFIISIAFIQIVAVGILFFLVFILA